MGAITAVILIITVMVSVSMALVYDPQGSVIAGSADNYYNDGPYGYNSYNGNNEPPNDLSNANREKLLALVTAFLQRGNNQQDPYSPFTDLFMFKGSKGKNRVNWRKWLGWGKNQIVG